MPNRSVVALVAALVLAAGQATAQAELVAQVGWDVSDARFGGLSGLELADDGRAFIVVGDDSVIIEGTLRRENGALTGIDDVRLADLQLIDPQRESRNLRDAEGIAGKIGGPLFISFESVHRVDRYDVPDAEPSSLPSHPGFRAFRVNGGLEALAIDEAGTLFAVPETPARRNTWFPVFRYEGEGWDSPFRITRSDDLSPVGADFGPDGALYVLERSFHGIFGFASRVRRFDPASTGEVDGEVLLRTRPGTHDNLEGIAAWRDADGAIRLTMVSDNNFNVFQRTEFVEYRLTE
ncbi:MAG: esterase-like activity of phytase family protein [Pseudomonadota bacterium]